MKIHLSDAVKEVLKCFTAGNTKKDGIVTYGLPAGVTCPNAGACKAFCYASTGNFRFPSVAGRGIKNHAISQRDNFTELLTQALRVLAGKGVKLIRLHQSGDFYDVKYVKAWFTALATLAAEGSTLEAYAYTKSFGLIVAARTKRPSNLTLIASEGGTLSAEDYVTSHPDIFVSIAKVAPVGAPIAEHFVGGSESDLENLRNAQAGLGLQLPAHGAKKRAVG